MNDHGFGIIDFLVFSYCTKIFGFYLNVIQYCLVEIWLFSESKLIIYLSTDIIYRY